MSWKRHIDRQFVFQIHGPTTEPGWRQLMLTVWSVCRSTVVCCSHHKQDADDVCHGWTSTKCRAVMCVKIYEARSVFRCGLLAAAVVRHAGQLCCCWCWQPCSNAVIDFRHPRVSHRTRLLGNSGDTLTRRGLALAVRSAIAIIMSSICDTVRCGKTLHRTAKVW